MKSQPKGIDEDSKNDPWEQDSLQTNSEIENGEESMEDDIEAWIDEYDGIEWISFQPATQN